MDRQQVFELIRDRLPGPTLLVLGDMGEVGEQGVEFHREVGKYALEKKISNLFALGEATKHAVDAFGKEARHFATPEELASSIKAKTILVKGSRFMRMERVVSALTGTAGGGH
jgi:UDP-N-acetylmuramoyl-tripeptide--D-alanyl-D-alanine ligase